MSKLIGFLVRSEKGIEVEVTKGEQYNNWLGIVFYNDSYLLIHIPTQLSIGGPFTNVRAATRAAFLVADIEELEGLWDKKRWREYRPLVEDLIYGNSRKSDFIE